MTNLQAAPLVEPIVDTGLQTQPKPLTYQDWYNESKKIVDLQAKAAQDQIQYATRNLAEDTARQLYGQNVGATSGVGQELASRNIQTALDRFIPQTSQMYGNLAKEALNYQQGIDTENRRFLQTYGLNPETGQAFGSEFEAKKYWEDKNLADEMFTIYGNNPETGQPFESEQEAKYYWATKTEGKNLIRDYGLNPETGKAFGSVAEAETYWEEKSAKGTLTREYGVNPETGQPFNSAQEARQYWNNIDTRNNLVSEYGLNPETGQPFGSVYEAQSYWEDTESKAGLTRKYGVNAETGKAFGSVAEAEQYWSQKGWDVELVREYGINPDTGQPFTSAQAAKTYWSNLAKSADIARDYGINPATGKAFESVFEAKEYWDNRAIQTDISAKYGPNPETGENFTSYAEADAYWSQKGADSAITQKYGLDMTEPWNPKPFASEADALAYWDKINLKSKYGVDADGNAFESQAAAEAYWKEQGANADLIAEFGVKPESIDADGNVVPARPFNSRQEALLYWEGLGFNTDLINKYGVADDGTPFKSIAEAEEFWTDRGFDADLVRRYGTRPAEYDKDGNLISEAKPFESEKEANDYYEQKLYDLNILRSDQEWDKTLLRKYGLNPEPIMDKEGNATYVPFKSEQEATDYFESRDRNFSILFDMAMAGNLDGGELLDRVLDEYGMTLDDVSLPEAKDRSIEAYIDAKIAANQPIDVTELNSILKLVGLDEQEITQDTLIYSPTFAKSILATDDENMVRQLASWGFEAEDPTYEWEFLGMRGDRLWGMKENEHNTKLFSKLYQTDPDFRDYVNTFLV